MGRRLRRWGWSRRRRRLVIGYSLMVNGSAGARARRLDREFAEIARRRKLKHENKRFLAGDDRIGLRVWIGELRQSAKRNLDHDIKCHSGPENLQQ